MKNDLFGIYIHIPFCIQRCSYCDFATYSKDQIQANQQYVDSLLIEADRRRGLFQNKELQTIYFGGGTPSLLTGQQIDQILSHLKSLNFTLADDIEITIEVNPATLDDDKCQLFKDAGVNRLSIGCQTFNDPHLKACKREHNSADTMRTIELTQKYFDNFSLDLLFSLPQQKLSDVENDLRIIRDIDPPHVSGYCLTLPTEHPMNKGRGSDDEQIEMFQKIFTTLDEIGLKRYEISNFAKPGFESKHNLLYWTDQNFWGLGLSAHSYKKDSSWGSRFWNPSSYKAYMDQIENLSAHEKIESSFAQGLYEMLSPHESLTDFCHTHLRLTDGLNRKKLRQKFGNEAEKAVEKKLEKPVQTELVTCNTDSWKLTERGVLLSNRVFSEILFSKGEIDNARW